MDMIYTFEQVLELLGVERRWIAAKVASGFLQSYKIGNKRFFLHSDIVEFIQVSGEKSKVD